MYSLETKGNVLLDATGKMLNLDSKETSNYIQSLHNSFIMILESKGFRYIDFKNTLIPQKNRRDILLVFDSTQINKSNYSTYIDDIIMKNMPSDIRTSYLSGDFKDISHSQEFAFKILNEHFDLSGLDEFHSDMFYFVYLNNLSDIQFNYMSTIPIEEKSYLGFVDMTYGSLLKDYCSFILVSRFIKNGKKIIGIHEDDADTSKNENLCFIDFSKYGYSFKSIPHSYYTLFLTYKIERSFVESDQNDIQNALIDLAGKECNLDIFKLKLRESKHQYLITNKNGVLDRLGMLGLTTEQFENILNEKIWSNYIYNFEYVKNYEVLKFTAMVEALGKGLDSRVKVQAALSYYPELKKIDVVSLY